MIGLIMQSGRQRQRNDQCFFFLFKGFVESDLDAVYIINKKQFFMKQCGIHHFRRKNTFLIDFSEIHKMKHNGFRSIDKLKPIVLILLYLQLRTCYRNPGIFIIDRIIPLKHHIIVIDNRRFLKCIGSNKCPGNILIQNKREKGGYFLIGNIEGAGLMNNSTGISGKSG